MQLAIVGFWSIICLVLVLLAEFKKELRILGILGCLLLTPLALWIATTGVTIQTGENVLYAGTDTTTTVNSGNATHSDFDAATTVTVLGITTTNTTITGNGTSSLIGNETTKYGKNETRTPTYSQISLPFFGFNELLFLLLEGLSFFGMFHYIQTSPGLAKQ